MLEQNQLKTWMCRESCKRYHNLLKIRGDWSSGDRVLSIALSEEQRDVVAAASPGSSGLNFALASSTI